MKRHQAIGKTLTLKVKFSDFDQITRSKSQINCFSDENTIFTVARRLLDDVLAEDARAIRLLGISMSNLNAIDGKVPVQLKIEFDSELDYE